MPAYNYDLHVHSCLSPCADDDMTPANIAGMASINGLHLLALTDHNSSKNCPAFFRHAARYGIVPVAGMELTTSEDIHAICLFCDLESAMKFDRIVEERLIRVKNKPEIFGHQYVVNDQDEPICEIEDLVINATTLDLSEAFSLVDSLGGVCYPAHIDREANGIVATLGTFPEDPPYTAFELACGDALESYRERFPILDRLSYVVSSDAHQLWNLSDGSNALTLNAPADDPQAVRRALIAYLKTNRR